jgi:flagellin-like hook-associated protein FlgL
VGSSLNTDVKFDTKLKTFLGLQVGTSPATFTPDSGATGTNGLIGVQASPSANTGKYALSYKVDATTGTSGVMKLTDGVKVSYADITKGGTQTVNFDNGINIELGSAFSSSSSITPVVFDVNAGTSLSFDFQVAELATDTLKVQFTATSLESLQLTDVDIVTPETAVIASAKLDAAMVAVNKSYAQLGAQQKQFEVYKDVLSSNIQNLQSALSEFVDADVPDAITRMGQASVQSQIASAMLVQANQKTEQLLSLTR